AWRNHRWDSFTLNTPNWRTRLPGAEYEGSDPDGFMSRSDVIAYLENYVAKFHLPVRYSVSVERVERNETTGLYLIRTNDGHAVTAWNVVIATGLLSNAEGASVQRRAAIDNTAGSLRCLPEPRRTPNRRCAGRGQCPIRCSDRRGTLS